ncbi:SRPBCC family protein [Rhodococcus sp. HNM0569]|uniref:SRPBCC family protein n=1 Tax=Rhodococcus sp. HNM0569 TaxID=2716340 RepID=UPI00146AE2E0|nr:SRPBCC family protein [Rhodococcus sp. HNM0569]NLU84837.1 SRPBCC family protein [Rhodococcus sp. HNM0569]
MRLRDTPTVEVSERLACSPERAWQLVTDIELPTRVDGELQRAEWLDGATGVALGARFRGYNASDQMGEWQTEPEVVEVEDGRRWVWRIGSAEAFIALWGFEVDPSKSGAVVRQWAKLGTGTSPLTAAIAQYPEREAAIIGHRMGVWRDGMAANLAALRELAEA